MKVNCIRHLLQSMPEFRAIFKEEIAKFTRLILGGNMNYSHRSRQSKLLVAAHLMLVSSLVAVSTSVAESASYLGPILFKQTNTRIIERNDVRWIGVPEDYPYLRFGSIMSSLDGSRILFNVACEFCPAGTGYSNRPFVADPTGANIQDVSDIFPSDLTSSWWGWGNMRINDDGSKIYIKAQRDVGYYGLKSLYYMELPSGMVSKAVSNDFGSSSFDWFTLNKDGSRLYLGKYDEGYDDTLQRYRRGLYYADLNGARNWYLDIFDLPCNQQCSNLNMMTYMGNSLSGDHTFFAWSSGQAGNICTGDDCNHNALWHTGLDGQATRLTPEEHYFVDTNTLGGWGPVGWRGISSEHGDTVLYAYKHIKGDPLELHSVIRSTGAEERLTWTTSLNGFDEYFITPSGDNVFVRGTMGNAGGLHYHTLFDLQTGTTRDSWSYFLPRVNTMSNMVQDRYYFVTYNDAIYRIDTKADVSGDFSQAPNITRIAFSGPVLWDNDASRLTVNVNIADQQGLNTIEKVILTVLVDGMESTYWPMGREPLAFPTGDPGSTFLYDDGTHGDLVADDGVFSFDAIATRKGDRDENGFNTWYFHHTLPNDVGVRIIAYDLDGNSTIADSTLTIADCAQAEKILGTDINGQLIVCATDKITLAGIAIRAGAEVHLNASSVVFDPSTHVEKGATLTVGAM